jgi:hypothetical protein
VTMNGYRITIKEFGDRFLWLVHDDPNPVAEADGTADSPHEALDKAVAWCNNNVRSD